MWPKIVASVRTRVTIFSMLTVRLRRLFVYTQHFYLRNRSVDSQERYKLSKIEHVSCAGLADASNHSVCVV